MVKKTFSSKNVATTSKKSTLQERTKPFSFCSFCFVLVAEWIADILGVKMLLLGLQLKVIRKQIDHLLLPLYV